jgi:hypothetical protein
VTHGGGGRQLEKGKTEVIEYRKVAASWRKVRQRSEYREVAARQRLMEEVAASWRKVRQRS